MDDQNQFVQEIDLPVTTPDEIRHAVAVFFYRRNLTLEQYKYLLKEAPGTLSFLHFIPAIGLFHSTLNNTTTPTADNYAKRVRGVFNSNKSSTFSQEHPELQFGFGITHRPNNNNMAKQHADHLGPADIPQQLQQQALPPPPPQQQLQQQYQPIVQQPTVNSPYHHQPILSSTHNLQQNQGGIGHPVVNQGLYGASSPAPQQPPYMNNQLPPQLFGGRGIQQVSTQRHPQQQLHLHGGADMNASSGGSNGGYCCCSCC